jgi:molybdenum cofactor cytidylyltransferase
VTPPPHTVALVLVAGAGRRLGNVPKCLIRLGGQTLLQRLLEALATLHIREARLVLGHHADAVTAHVNTLPPDQRPRLLRNPTPGDEPADSLQWGLRSLTSMPERLLVLLGDQPLLGAPQIDAALRAFEQRERGRHALVPQVDGRPGHPAVLDGLACAQLRNHAGGLRAWRRERPEAVALWNTPDPAHTFDLDTPLDLDRLAQTTGLAVALPPNAPMPQCGMHNG